MKRLLIITALLALLLPVQAVGTDAKKQYSSPRRYPAEIECAINRDIQKADSLVKAGKPDEALTFYKKSLKSKDSLYNRITTSQMEEILSLQYGQAHAAKRAKAQYVPPNLLIHIRYHHFCIVAFQHPHIPEPETPAKR